MEINILECIKISWYWTIVTVQKLTSMIFLHTEIYDGFETETKFFRWWIQLHED